MALRGPERLVVLRVREEVIVAQMLLCGRASTRGLRARGDGARYSPTSVRPTGDGTGSVEDTSRALGFAYAAPELVAHYVEAHGYLPPTDFVHAVLSPGAFS